MKISNKNNAAFVDKGDSETTEGSCEEIDGDICRHRYPHPEYYPVRIQTPYLLEINLFFSNLRQNTPHKVPEADVRLPLVFLALAVLLCFAFDSYRLILGCRLPACGVPLRQ